MYNRFWFVILLICFSALTVAAQTDTLGSIMESEAQPSRPQTFVRRDSATLARWMARQDSIRFAQDSLRAIGDSLSMVYIVKPDPFRPNRFLDSLMEHYQVKNLNFQEWATKFPKKVQKYDEGKARKKGESWVIGFLFLLLALFAILRNFFSKELFAIIQAFYSNRILGQINKEEKFFNSWPFVFLYILFGFTIGMFLYQCGEYFQLSYDYDGIIWFLRLSVAVILAYTLKVLIVALLGFLFKAGKMAKEYISILFLSYFNGALLFLPLVIGISLTPSRYALFYIYLSFMLIACVYFFQFLRAINNILSGYKFPLMYLFIYLCALEICPLLILFKALRF